MNLDETVRDLITKELELPEKPTLALIARRLGISYKKIWYFYKQDKLLSAVDAQRAYETLSGKPLFQDTDV